jgi:hypothetical protein
VRDKHCLLFSLAMIGGLLAAANLNLVKLTDWGAGGGRTCTGSINPNHA